MSLAIPATASTSSTVSSDSQRSEPERDSFQAGRPLRRVILVGAPNVGKSVLFGALTGRYVVVSNYPGTTVELTKGKFLLQAASSEESSDQVVEQGGEVGGRVEPVEDDASGVQLEIIDTPGLYGLKPSTEEERVARTLVMEAGATAAGAKVKVEEAALLVHVVEARGITRALPLTLQLRALGCPMLLVVNMMDESLAAGEQLDLEGLAATLGMPVIGTVATKGEGLPELRTQLLRAARGQLGRPELPASLLPAALRERCEAVAAELPEGGRFPPLGEALLLCWRDREALEQLEIRSQAAAKRIDHLLNSSARSEASKDVPLQLLPSDARSPVADGEAGPGMSPVQVAKALFDQADQILGPLLNVPDHRASRAERLHKLLINPWSGVPLLLLTLYLGLYQFVGVFGAGVVVDFLEKQLFGVYVKPAVNSLLLALLPGDAGVSYWVRELIGGQYGVITLGVTYAFAIVLPIVFLFFLFFSLLEDSGYFPRLAMLVDRLFKRIGLNGRAVIPVVLGFACDTMATMVTRVQETKRERIITTLLLALAIPCSAQYGVIVALLAGAPGFTILGTSWAFLVWAGLIGFSFFATGYLASKAVKGAPASFYMELPPLRWPRPLNVAAKVAARMKWYFFEVLPVFVFASVLIWVGRLTGLFGVLTTALNPLVGFLGLPPATSEIFLYGFFRRDFGAAGLYKLSGEGLLSTGQLLVASVTLTLFLPCVAQLLIMWKERGPKATVIMVTVVFAVAFLVGGSLRAVLAAFGAMG